jgi:uncharacterized RDD family membrane protein YckC
MTPPPASGLHSAPGTLTEDDTVTGEAVALELPPAGIGVRLLSATVDVVLSVAAFALALLLGTFAVAGTDAALEHVVLVCSTAFAFLVLPTLVTTWSGGRSLGRWLTGTRVVRDDAGPISAQHAFTRSLVGVVEVFLAAGAPAFFAILLSNKGKRLGDHAAGTYVVRERAKLAPGPRPVMPPHLAHWAVHADMAALPVHTALAVRQFLAHAPDAGNEARARVGQELAARVQASVAPPPPPGTHPEDFLAAVLVERGRRDALRLARDEELRRRLSAT